MIPFQKFYEIAYPGNVGIHELMQFYSKASDEEKDVLERFMEIGDFDKILNLIHRVTGTKLAVTA
jgi:hypothetical protein